MKSALAFAVVVGMLMVACTQASAHFGLKSGKKCDSISYSPHSDYASYDIKIRQIPGGCQRARHWLKRDKGGWKYVPTSHCVRRLDTNGLYHEDYRCTWPGTRRAMVWATS